MFLNRVFRKEWFNRFPWFLASLIKNGRTLRKCYNIFSRCKNSWSNLTLKCNANTFVKVDARMEGNCRRTISYLLKGILAQSFSCKKLNNRKRTANTVRNTRRTTLCWMRGKIMNFYFSSLLCICPSLFENYLNKANYIIYEKLSRVFSVAGFRFEEKYSHQLQCF